MKKLALSIGLVAVLGGAACGGGDSGGIDEGPSASEGTVNPTAMRGAVTNADTLRTAVQAMNGDSLAAGAVGLSLGAMSAVSPKAGKALTVTQQMLTSDGGAMTGDKNCNASGCTFTNYGNAQAKISGSVMATDAGDGKKVVWNLTGTGSLGASAGGVQNIDFKYEWKGDITVSATSLAGMAGATWKGSGSVQGMDFSYDYGSYIKFDAVTLTDRCPTAGSVFAKWWMDVKAGGRSQTQAYQGTHTFSGCTR